MSISEIEKVGETWPIDGPSELVDWLLTQRDELLKYRKDLRPIITTKEQSSLEDKYNSLLHRINSGESYIDVVSEINNDTSIMPIDSVFGRRLVKLIRDGNLAEASVVLSRLAGVSKRIPKNIAADNLDDAENSANNWFSNEFWKEAQRQSEKRNYRENDDSTRGKRDEIRNTIRKSFQSNSLGEIDSKISHLNDVYDRIVASYESMENRLEGLQIKISEYAESEADYVEDLKSQYQQLVSDHKKEMDGIRAAVESKAGVEAADTFWGNKREEHRKTARRLLIALFACMAGSLVLLPAAVAAIAGALKLGFYEFNALHIVAVGLPTVIVLWVLKIIASLFRSNNDRAADAQERVAMLSVFIALLRTGSVTEEERAVILQALFRPFAVSPEDSLPNPVWEAIMKRIDSAPKPSSTGT